ncbi:hypothetical protein ACSBR1_008156 [Camellia fascicularis]
MAVQRQQSNKPVPLILVTCADYLILSGICMRLHRSIVYSILILHFNACSHSHFSFDLGLNSQELFKSEGDKKVIQQLVSLYNQDSNASLPEGIDPVDVAALVKCYLASLPEPLTTFELYNEIRDARSSIIVMRNILKKLPTVNYMTLELITALLLRVSQKSLLNKMDARSLGMEMAPIIMWQKGHRLEYYKQFWNQPAKTLSRENMDSTSNLNAWDMLDEEGEGVDADASSLIPLDDGLPIDFSAIEVVHCLIEHHNAIFTDANETVWR